MRDVCWYVVHGGRLNSTRVFRKQLELPYKLSCSSAKKDPLFPFVVLVVVVFWAFYLYVTMVLVVQGK